MIAAFGRGAPAARVRPPVAFVNADARGKTACIRPGQRRVVPPPFGSVGGNVSIIAQVSFIFPSRYSVLALLVLTSPLVSTTQPQGIICNTPQVFAGCSRLCLRLCLRVAKIRTFAPLFVPLRCAGTIALLSDFCSAGWAAHAAFLSQGIISDTPQVFAGCSRFYPTRKIRDFSRGDPVCACGFAPQSILALLRYFAGTPLCFRKRKMQDVRLLRVFSLCLETMPDRNNTNQPQSKRFSDDFASGSPQSGAAREPRREFFDEVKASTICVGKEPQALMRAPSIYARCRELCLAATQRRQ